MRHTKNQPSEPIKGLYRYCSTCRKWLKQGQECDHNWFYRVLIRTKQGKLRSKNLKKNLLYEDLVKAVDEFRNFVITESTIFTATIPINFDMTVEILSYRDYLSDVGVPESDKKNLNKKYINDQIRCLNWFNEFILSDKKGGIKNLNDIDNVMVNRFIKCLQSKSLSMATIKNSISILSKWYNYKLGTNINKIENPWNVKL